MTAAAALAGAALIRAVTLSVSGGVRAAEVAICALVLALVLGSHRVNRLGAWSGALVVLYSLTPALAASVGLRLVAMDLPDYAMVTTLVFAAILLGTEVGATLSTALLASSAVLVVFVELWLDTVGIDANEIASLVVATVLLAGLRLLLITQVERTRSDVVAESMRGHVFTALARRLGVSGDLASVATATLEVCRETFPQATGGGIVLKEGSDDVLRSPGVTLRVTGVAPEVHPSEIAPGEGLAGIVFATGEARLWPTALDISKAHRNLRESTRQRLRDERSAFIRSAIGAPLTHSDGEVVGSLVLICHAHEHAWSASDLEMMQTIADEAGRSIERARTRQVAFGEPTRDAITGLVTQREARAALDKELARARRAGDTLAVAISQIAGIGPIGDAWGRDARVRLLRLYADVVQTTLRREDTAARYSEQDFVWILPGAEQNQARAIAARIGERFRAAARQ
ncbi:MAG: diguanylate cyclase, partial [Candidatus Dormibacteraeota bacterium]|nr:diguanylate cyclase [Candidatus Dormibacteraeota bacterium]